MQNIAHSANKFISLRISSVNDKLFQMVSDNLSLCKYTILTTYTINIAAIIVQDTAIF